MTKTNNTFVTRRGIEIALGCLWLLDGLLQLQPLMFTSKFATGVIALAAQGQPWFISGPMHFFMGLFLWQPALCDTGIAVIQVALGVLILWKRTHRLGLLLSAGWGLFVWLVGEGLSGLASGHALMLMGSPGAALVYALLALGALPIFGARSDQRPAYWLLVAWIVIWVVGALYQVLPGQNTVANVGSMISANSRGAPQWLASVDTSVASYLKHFGTTTTPPENSMAGMPGMAVTPVQTAGPTTQYVSGFWVFVLVALLQLVIAFAVILPGAVRIIAVVAGSLLSLGFWVVGQSMGSYFSGLATDPNTGPLLVLLGFAVLGCTQRDAAVKQFFVRKKDCFLNEVRALNEG